MNFFFKIQGRGECPLYRGGGKGAAASLQFVLTNPPPQIFGANAPTPPRYLGAKAPQTFEKKTKKREGNGKKYFFFYSNLDLGAGGGVTPPRYLGAKAPPSQTFEKKTKKREGNWKKFKIF